MYVLYMCCLAATLYANRENAERKDLGTVCHAYNIYHTYVHACMFLKYLVWTYTYIFSEYTRFQLMQIRKTQSKHTEIAEPTTAVDRHGRLNANSQNRIVNV